MGLIYFTTFDGANEPSVSWMVNRGKQWVNRD